jgi:heptosyltransferase-2
LILLGLNPGAEYGPAKRWPAASFAAVVREVSRKFGNCAWLAFGGSGDRPVCSEIARLADCDVLNLAGQTSLRQLMALLKLCRVLLTNDTGPMHVAAALGTPVVVPFGSTSPELTGPGLPGDARHQLLQSAAPCSPCFRRVCPIDFRCMAGISPERVIAAVSRAIPFERTLPRPDGSFFW